MSQTQILKVEGMSCQHCVKNITNGLQELSGVKEVIVDLGAKTVSVEFDAAATSLVAIKETIEDLGFDVVA